MDAAVSTEEQKMLPMEIALSRDRTEIANMLSEATGKIPDDLKIQQMFKAMSKEDTEAAEKEFKDLLATLTPELVSS